ncbi:MAG: NAD(P)/FAD-dependent oxidoreductase [Prochlorococcaceae cyanobacterium]
MVGGGIVGSAACWLLQQRGHRVTLIDAADPRSGSTAALGLLMAQVFHRSSGRAWRLRQRSLALWGDWIAQLQAAGHGVQLNRGLLLLASSPDELSRQQQLCAERQAMGLPLRLLTRSQLEALKPSLPAAALGGLWSDLDGQLDPVPVIGALRQQAQAQGAIIRSDRVIALASGTPDGWQLRLASGDALQASALLLCTGSGSSALLQQLNLPTSAQTPLQAVLGQALELEAAADAPPWSWQGDWPAAVVWQGINLVPRPQGRLWLGATLEPGECANPDALLQMAQLHGHAPPWLQQARAVRQWQGLRLRPDGRPAPWLEQLGPGLWLASGHYRNGVLLAPATAEWLADQLEPR